MNTVMLNSQVRAWKVVGTRTLKRLPTQLVDVSLFLGGRAADVLSALYAVGSGASHERGPVTGLVVDHWGLIPGLAFNVALSLALATVLWMKRKTSYLRLVSVASWGLGVVNVVLAYVAQSL